MRMRMPDMVRCTFVVLFGWEDDMYTILYFAMSQQIQNDWLTLEKDFFLTTPLHLIARP
jgi:hypothetical protein